MEVTSFTEADLARLALSTRLRDLCEELRVAVAADDPGRQGGDAGSASLAQRLWSLLAGEIPSLQEAIVHYVRACGGSWADVAALGAPWDPSAAPWPEEARSRWEGLEPPRTAEPGAQAAALDEWYVKHAQLEPLARVRDPFSRLLAAHTRRPHECLICAKYQGGAYPAYGGYTDPPGGYLLDDGVWRVAHGPAAYWPAGTLLVESNRHFLDYAEMNQEELASIGPLLERFSRVLKEATGAPRVHVWSNMEGVEHFHVWMVPRVGEVASGRSFIGSPGYCGLAEAETAIGRVREAMAATGASR